MLFNVVFYFIKRKWKQHQKKKITLKFKKKSVKILKDSKEKEENN